MTDQSKANRGNFLSAGEEVVDIIVVRDPRTGQLVEAHAASAMVVANEPAYTADVPPYTPDTYQPIAADERKPNLPVARNHPLGRRIGRLAMTAGLLTGSFAATDAVGMFVRTGHVYDVTAIIADMGEVPADFIKTKESIESFVQSVASVTNMTKDITSGEEE